MVYEDLSYFHIINSDMTVMIMIPGGVNGL